MDAVFSGLGGSSFSYDDPNNLLTAYLQQNIHAFSAAKSLTELQTFNSLMIDADGKVKPFSQFRDDVARTGALFNKTYLETEYNTAVASAQMAQHWDEFSEDEYLQISTAHDNRVRPWHAVLDGYTAPKSSAVWRKLYPPFDWNCRCTVIPGVAGKENKDIDPSGLMKEARVPKYFQRNTGITKAVFSDDHPYYINSYKEAKQMTADEVYGMQSVKNIYAHNDFAAAKALESKEEANNWWKDKAGSLRGSFDVKDYAGQTVRFGNEFRNHVFEGNKDDRFLHVSNSEDIVTKPDEVWSQVQDGKLKRFYLKYYETTPYIVRVDQADAYTMHDFLKADKLNETSVESIRKGTLLYRKN